MSVIVVGGALANKPHNGGEAWVRLSFVHGLRRLGFDVYLVEELAAGTCTGLDGRPATFAESQNLAFFRDVVRDFGLADRAAVVCDDGGWEGLSRADVRDAARDAELVLNISGHLDVRRLLGGAARTRAAYVDIDPGYTQVWHLDGLLGSRVAEHDVHFTIGENIGRPGCTIPTGGIAWRPTRQPVVLEQWPCDCEAGDRFTTVARWRGPFGPVRHAGRTYGLKVHEFRRILELPDRAPGPFEIALDIDPADVADRDALVRHGWQLVDPRAVAGDPGAFREYVRRSAAEVSAAQGVYVETGSGWFSDRTTRYLASGRPVLVQDTSLADLPVGSGLLTFRTLEEAASGVRAIRADYAAHARAARAVAEEHFDSDRVLARLLDDAMAAKT